VGSIESNNSKYCCHVLGNTPEKSLILAVEKGSAESGSEPKTVGGPNSNLDNFPERDTKPPSVDKHNNGLGPVKNENPMGDKEELSDESSIF
jgi:hypothetical protein